MSNKTIKKRHKAYNFGEMLSVDWDDHKVEIMRFQKEGSSHKHTTDEIAILLSGQGTVVVGEEEKKVSELMDKVAIPAETPHHMIPENDMVMLIAYPKEGELEKCKTKML